MSRAFDRTDLETARNVLESVFKGYSARSRRDYEEFLADSIQYLSQHHADRWGASLFPWGVRLNVGWVECLVLSSDGLRVLAKEGQAPRGTTFDQSDYLSAPGCKMTTISLADIPRAIASFTESHHAALSVGARKPSPRNIKEAHSIGVTAFLSESLRRPIPNPTYVSFAVEIPETHQQIQTWRRLHPRGFLINLMSAKSGMLHQADCAHLGGHKWKADSSRGLASKQKICALDSGELEKWAKQNGVSSLTECEQCRPAAVEPGRKRAAQANGPKSAPVVEVHRPAAEGSGFWVIKASPRKNNFSTLPIMGVSHRWYSSRIPETFSPGDTLFIWASAPTLRMIGSARLVDPHAGLDGKLQLFRVEYLTNFINGPTIKELRRDPIVQTASFLKVGPAGTIFPLSQEQGSRILQGLTDSDRSPGTASREKVDLDSAAELQSQTLWGAGFGDAATNRLVEREAIKAATLYYEANGWDVCSKEAENIGFDLLCQKARDELHVEVKGVSGRGLGFILTAGEHRRAKRDPYYALCLVESALTPSPTIKVFVAGEIFKVFDFVPLAYKAKHSGLATGD
jgi:hypothetical protein